uniref:Uncharacterized protein n=2 Tax=Oryza TaxID=4527 RepID=A0A0E0GP41_ORYNI
MPLSSPPLSLPPFPSHRHSLHATVAGPPLSPTLPPPRRRRCRPSPLPPFSPTPSNRHSLHAVVAAPRTPPHPRRRRRSGRRRSPRDGFRRRRGLLPPAWSLHHHRLTASTMPPPQEQGNATAFSLSRAVLPINAVSPAPPVAVQAAATSAVSTNRHTLCLLSLSISCLPTIFCRRSAAVRRDLLHTPRHVWPSQMIAGKASRPFPLIDCLIYLDTMVYSKAAVRS